MGQQKFSLADVIYGFLGHIFPSCRDALNLVEKGQKTPLKWHEKFALKYNSPLCIHCNCNREKFDKEYEKLKAIESEREKKQA
jgi:hypothetical protein